mgnify:CR=1 FL=1
MKERQPLRPSPRPLSPRPVVSTRPLPTPFSQQDDEEEEEQTPTVRGRITTARPRIPTRPEITVQRIQTTTFAPEEETTAPIRGRPTQRPAVTLSELPVRKQPTTQTRLTTDSFPIRPRDREPSTTVSSTSIEDDEFTETISETPSTTFRPGTRPQTRPQTRPARPTQPRPGTTQVTVSEEFDEEEKIRCTRNRRR